MSRLAISDTLKLYINGAFVRSESGLIQRDVTHKQNIAKASRKDARDTLRVSVQGAKKMAGLDPLNRGQIVYKIAESLEQHRGRFVASKSTLDKAVDNLVATAGWSDKANAVLGEVCSPSYNITAAAEVVGIGSTVVFGLNSLDKVTAAIGAALSVGNAITIVAPEDVCKDTLSLGEVLACSDVPHGSVNLLSGYSTDVYKTLANATSTRGLLATTELYKEYGPLAAYHLARLEKESALKNPSDVAILRWQVDAKTTIASSCW